MFAETSGGPVPIERIAVEETDITINLPVIKDHGGAGVTGALKNIAFGCYRNHRQAHSGNCDPYIAETYAHFIKTTKVPLIILDATEGCFDGGPAPQNSQTVWRENAIYVATDPVALDVVLRDVIHAKRRRRACRERCASAATSRRRRPAGSASPTLADRHRHREGVGGSMAPGAVCVGRRGVRLMTGRLLPCCSAWGPSSPRSRPPRATCAGRP